jgi:hypothetical protein
MADKNKGKAILLNLKRLSPRNLDSILNVPGISGNPEILNMA